MRIESLEQVTDLNIELKKARKRLNVARSLKEDLVPAWAGLEADYGRIKLDPVALLPVSKELVISAATREVDKIISKLAELGVQAEREERPDGH